MTDSENQEEELNVEECQYNQGCNNTTTKNTKQYVYRKEKEDLVESNELPPTVKERFCDKSAEVIKNYQMNFNKKWTLCSILDK